MQVSMYDYFYCFFPIFSSFSFFFLNSGDDKDNGYPYTIAAALMEGGKPESILNAKELEESRLYFVNFHYQGSNKNSIAYDVCRLLLFSGNISFFSFCCYFLIFCTS
jgi:hypothetical protein